MIPVDQTIFEPGKGDCMRACVASIFELPLKEVPNFMALGPSRFQTILYRFCKQYGIISLDVTIQDSNALPNVYLIAVGESPGNPDINHAVIYYNGKMVHDPHPDKTGIIGEPETYTIFVIEDPSRFVEYKDLKRKIRDLELKLLDENSIHK